MKLHENLDRVANRYEELAASMAQGGAHDPSAFAAMSREYAELTPVVEAIEEMRRAESEIADLTELLDDPDTDAEMAEMAHADLAELKRSQPALEQQLLVLLLPKDAADAKNAILEVRAGTGGDEAALFAADLFRMYQRYADLRGWKVEIMNSSSTDIGGTKEVTATISGRNVFSRLKFESGVHRVQRVPSTESSGRIHTSAATVAVLPEAEEIDVEIDETELRIDTFRASGPGGQSVNTTDSAIRITHLPTGLVVSQQDEKSQHKNKAKALRVLRARLYEVQRNEANAERAAARKGQVGSGDRSERIRTYNFPQGRITDHRINLTLHKLDKVLTGEALDEIIDLLIADDQAAMLAAIQ